MASATRKKLTTLVGNSGAGREGGDAPVFFYLGLAVLGAWMLIIIILVRHYWIGWLTSLFRRHFQRPLPTVTITSVSGNGPSRAHRSGDVSTVNKAPVTLKRTPIDVIEADKDPSPPGTLPKRLPPLMVAEPNAAAAGPRRREESASAPIGPPTLPSDHPPRRQLAATSSKHSLFVREASHSSMRHMTAVV